MKVGIAFDLAPVVPTEGPDDRFEEFDKPETVEAIARVIRDDGHDVVLLGDGREFLTKVLADPPDFVFNIAEGEGVGRCREARVPAVLEMLGIPYSGSDPLTLAASLDKEVSKRLVSCNVPVGKTFHDLSYDERMVDDGRFSDFMDRGFLSAVYDLFEVNQPGDRPDLSQRPLILKPNFEGSSKGIRDSCIATSEAEVIAIYQRLRKDYEQPILIEEYIEGEEVTVGIVGNGKSFEILGTMRVVPRNREKRFVYSLEVKRDWRNRVDYECPAQIPGFNMMRTIEASAKDAYYELGCRDFARIDFRVSDGIVYFIEANPLPGLSPGVSDLVILAEGHGIGYSELILKIFNASLTRVGLK